VRARTAANRAARHSAAAVVLVVAGAAGLADTGTHTIRPGETASEIAASHGTTVGALAAANGLADADRIVAGQVLVIPGATPTAPATVIHVVAPGETLAAIAGEYGTTVAAVASANGISDPNLVRIGQRLTLPAGGGSPAPAAVTHTVSRGETLAVIARQYGTTVGAIVSANDIANPNLVRIGEVLTIPAGSGASGSGVPASTSAYAATGGADGLTGVGGTHVVAPGETLAGIARRYGIAAADLAAANGLLPPHTVFAHARYRLDAHNRLPSDIAACPVVGATFVNDWGFPRSGGRAHEGNDLFAARGTAVRAPVAGTVSFATGAIGGKQFRLVAADGTIYLGSHLDGFGTAGPVAAGDTVGFVGDSGNAAGSRTHVHFEVHPEAGVAMNPYPLLRQACG
jgi:LysM repeat protein